MRRDPYCSNCGYTLTGCVESSKCPECGKPLVEVLTRDPVSQPLYAGVRRRSEQLLFGLPLIDVAFGPYGEERFGHARGFIALGDRATGVIACGGRSTGIVAFGGLSVGVFAFGGMAVGLFALGGLSLGLLLALGGQAIGGIAFGGCAIGGLAFGGLAAGYGATGGMAYGHYAEGGRAIGTFILSGARRDAEAVAFFQNFGFLKSLVASFSTSLWRIVVLTIGISIASTAPALLMQLGMRWARRGRDQDAAESAGAR